MFATIQNRAFPIPNVLAQPEPGADQLHKTYRSVEECVEALRELHSKDLLTAEHFDQWNDIMASLSDILIDANAPARDRAHAAHVIAGNLILCVTLRGEDTEAARHRFAAQAVDLTLEWLQREPDLSAHHFQTLIDRLDTFLATTPTGQQQVELGGMAYPRDRFETLLNDFKSRTESMRQQARLWDATMRGDDEARLKGDFVQSIHQSVHWPSVEDMADGVVSRMRTHIGAPLRSVRATREAVQAWLNARPTNEMSQAERDGALDALSPNFGYPRVVDQLLPVLWTYIEQHPDGALKPQLKERLASTLTELGGRRNSQGVPSNLYCMDGWRQRLSLAFLGVDPQLNQFAQAAGMNEEIETRISEIAQHHAEALQTEVDDLKALARLQGQTTVDIDKAMNRHVEHFKKQVFFECACVRGVSTAQVQTRIEAALLGFDVDAEIAQTHPVLKPIENAIREAHIAITEGRELMRAIGTAQDRIAVERGQRTMLETRLRMEQTRFNQQRERVEHLQKQLDVLNTRFVEVLARKVVDSDLLIGLVRDGNVDALRILVMAKPNLGNIRDADKNSLLHIAAQHNHPEIIRLIGTKNAPVKTANFRGETPLHVAIGHNAHEAIEALIELGVDLEARDHQGHPPLHMAVRNNNLGAIQTLLKKGTRTDAMDHDRCTPLQLAVLLDKIPALEELLKNDRIDPQQKGDFGGTALHLAAEKGNVEAIKALARHRATVINVRDSNGRTPLHIAVEKGMPDAFDQLLSLGADIEARDGQDFTVVHIAARFNQTSMIAKLVDTLGRNVNSRTVTNQTPLHIAAYHGNQGVLQALLARGADPRVMDEDESTARDLAAIKKHHAIMRDLDNAVGQPNPLVRRP
ncbi:MAG TPA: ankyrin repeat domain-containing protein [Burkholderiaceae bacterium]|nr:ankyrin repeat domain-containing protein [Burkholderiaceae bacterium]